MEQLIMPDMCKCDRHEHWYSSETGCQDCTSENRRRKEKEDVGKQLVRDALNKLNFKRLSRGTIMRIIDEA